MSRPYPTLAAALAVCSLTVALRAQAPSAPPFRLGLNGVFIGNGTNTTDQSLAQFNELGTSGLRHTEPGDVGWTAVQSANGIFNFTQADAVLFSSYSFGALPTFFGTATENHYVPPGSPTTTSWSAAVYGAQTTTYLQTVVNRYKSITHHWEIANEMTTKTTPPAGFTPAGYAEFLVFNRTAIRAADPRAQVVIAGELGNYGQPFSIAYDWLSGVLAAGGGAGFDVFNYHDYKSWWTLPAHYDQYRALLNNAGLAAVPIWVTECSQSSNFLNANVNPAYASPDGQAADVWRRPCLLFGKGVQTFFWHSFYSGGANTGGFQNMGLLDSTTGAKKKSWHAMKLLLQKIEGFATATLLSTGTVTDDNTSGGSGAWVVRFDFADGTRRYVAWSPDNQSYTLTGFTGVANINLTTVVPTTLSADGQTPTWATSSRTVSNGSVALTLADAPVLIEPVGPATGSSRVVNVSTRGLVGTGANVLIAGFYVNGSTAKNVLIRAVGPTLANYGVTGALADPKLELYDGAGVKIQENDNWSTEPHATLLSATAARTGGFALNAGSKESMLIASLPPGSYSAQVSGVSGTTGVALVEVYDADQSAAAVTASRKLINVSTRGQIGVNGELLIAGFAVTGATPKQLLIRAAGPTLAAGGLTGAISDPKLELFAGGTKINENDNWGGGPALVSAATSVGAFALTSATSKDAALLVSLAPGNYTVQVSGVGGATGLGLVEVYEVAGN